MIGRGVLLKIDCPAQLATNPLLYAVKRYISLSTDALELLRWLNLNRNVPIAKVNE